MENEREHTHNYQLQRGVIEAGHAYMFWLCRVSGCDEPHKMTVEPTEAVTWPEYKQQRGFRG